MGATCVAAATSCGLPTGTVVRAGCWAAQEVK
uniref:Uncharacterized protein n=1 Tax=Anopheles dirus TaxID=7168 RepID=A0A182NVZ0_9DIPT